MKDKAFVVVPWHNKEQRNKFLDEWVIDNVPPFLILQQDVLHEGCGVTKNKGVTSAIRRGAQYIAVLDDDCYPDTNGPKNLEDFLSDHIENIENPRQVRMFDVITNPQSRGTPYHNNNLFIEYPVACSMGFWTGIGDYDAIGQLVHGKKPMHPIAAVVKDKYFALSGMNICFKPEWWPWCQFIDVPRYDDIWMGWLWQKEAYRKGYCFSLNGPLVRHSRQSNVWDNLLQEARYAQENETLWKKIAMSPSTSYIELLDLLPEGVRV